MSRPHTTITVPVTSDPNEWLLLQLPRPMYQDEWESFLQLLDVMRVGRVEPRPEPPWDPNLEGATADSPAGLPPPANADQRFDEMDGG